MKVAILDYGMGNLRSVARAVERVGGSPQISSDPQEVLRADAMVVPGVGNFGACVRNLELRGLARCVRQMADQARPVLAICVGMQLLFEASEEDPAPGLALLPGASRRLPAEVKVPHMGWNTVRWTRRHPLVEGIPSGTRFCFVHSYAPDVSPGLTVGVTEHGRPFSAAVAHGSIFGTQFHPEKSGEAGLLIYERFLKEAAA